MQKVYRKDDTALNLLQDIDVNKNVKIIENGNNTDISIKINKLVSHRRSILIVGNCNSLPIIALLLLNSDKTNVAKLHNVLNENVFYLTNQSDDENTKSLEFSFGVWSTVAFVSLDKLTTFI